jgi:hypothetical protein
LSGAFAGAAAGVVCAASADGAIKNTHRPKAQAAWIRNCSLIGAGVDARTTAGQEAGATFLETGATSLLHARARKRPMRRVVAFGASCIAYISRKLRII